MDFHAPVGNRRQYQFAHGWIRVGPRWEVESAAPTTDWARRAGRMTAGDSGVGALHTTSPFSGLATRQSLETPDGGSQPMGIMNRECGGSIDGLWDRKTPAPGGRLVNSTPSRNR